MKERFSCYEFEIKYNNNKYTYKLYTKGCMPYYDGVIESDEWYETEQEARFAAIGHISLKENGEG